MERSNEAKPEDSGRRLCVRLRTDFRSAHLMAARSEEVWEVEGTRNVEHEAIIGESARKE